MTSEGFYVRKFSPNKSAVRLARNDVKRILLEIPNLDNIKFIVILVRRYFT